MKNILILAPHPDDEIVGTCIIIKKLLEKKINVTIFFLTTGIISKNDMWFFNRANYEELIKIRLNEAKKTLKELGIKKFFLQKIPSRSLTVNLRKTFIKLKRIMDNNNFDCLFVPAYEGGHQDHDVANFLSSFFIQRVKVFEYSEYNYFKKKINSNNFIKKSGQEKVLKLSCSEILFKKKLLRNYKSEKKNLNYVKFDFESYRPLENYNYALPAHKGVLFYRRFAFFSWHPRVDETQPENVCKNIIDFRKSNEK